MTRSRDRVLRLDQRSVAVDAVVRFVARYRAPLAIAGAIVCVGQVGYWFTLGAWPPHDSVNIWLAGRHLLEAQQVYTGTLGSLLVFVYPPPAAVLAGVAALLPAEVFCVLLLLAQALALRWVVGSWLAVGMVGWLPWVPRALVTGNVDFLVAAAILAGVTARPGGGILGAVMTSVKVSPALAVRRWREFILSGVVLIAATLPWFDLWPAWFQYTLLNLGTPFDGPSLLFRLPVVLALLIVRRAPARAAAAALATPAFYWGHSAVLLLPAARMWWESRRSANATAGTGEPGRKAGGLEGSGHRGGTFG